MTAIILGFAKLFELVGILLFGERKPGEVVVVELKRAIRHA